MLSYNGPKIIHLKQYCEQNKKFSEVDFFNTCIGPISFN